MDHAAAYTQSISAQEALLGASGAHARTSELPRFSATSALFSAEVAAFLLVVCQITDAVLTYWGVHLFGISMEGNYIIRSLMESYGVIPALTIVKVLACLGIFFLLTQAARKRWITGALFCITALYVAFAIIPWSLLLIEFY